MRFPDLLQNFIRLQYQVAGLLTDVEQLRRELHAITPEGDSRSLVSRETGQITIDEFVDGGR